jgi:hypothetical protein
MKRLAVALLAIVILAGCAGLTGNQQRDPLETAKLTYGDLSLAYEAAMLSIKDAHDQKLMKPDKTPIVSDADWNAVKNAEKTVQKYDPLVRVALNLWATTGVKPTSFDDTLSKLTGAAEIAISTWKNTQKGPTTP